MLQLHVKTSQAYLITTGFLHKYSYEPRDFAVVSVNRHQLQGDFVPLTLWPGPWTPLEAQTPDLHFGPSLPFHKYFWHYLWNKLCTADILGQARNHYHAGSVLVFVSSQWGRLPWGDILRGIHTVQWEIHYWLLTPITQSMMLGTLWPTCRVCNGRQIVTRVFTVLR